MNARPLAAVNRHEVSWQRTVKPPARNVVVANEVASGPARPPRL
jgi:hypothetical protein